MTMDDALRNITQLTEDEIQKMIDHCDFVIAQYQDIINRFSNQGCTSCKQRRLDRMVIRRQRFVEEQIRRNP
jgi:hypothetical protein